MDLRKNASIWLTLTHTHMQYTKASLSFVLSRPLPLHTHTHTHTFTLLRSWDNSLSSQGAIQWMPSKNIWSPKGKVPSKRSLVMFSKGIWFQAECSTTHCQYASGLMRGIMRGWEYEDTLCCYANTLPNVEMRISLYCTLISCHFDRAKLLCLCVYASFQILIASACH